VIACFPVYRTYADPHSGLLQPADKAAIDLAVREAIRRNPEQERSVFEFIRRTLTAPSDEDEGGAGVSARLQFNLKLQQLTGPVMAKGLEDTAFYRFNRLTSLNEVGSDPNRFGALPVEVHTGLGQRGRDWPHAMLASSTHDTKRSEDVRARISALSGFPRDWRAAINRWARLNRRHRTRVEGSAAPDRADEYLLYQTLLGAWPGIGAIPDDMFVERIAGYMQKAVREAQRRSNWANPNTEYENALETFVRTLLDPARSEAFLADFGGMAERVIRAGWFTSLAATVLKLTAPGVPDFYQGTELWDLSLVDPDNRRPVDFAARQATLCRLRKRAVGSRLVRELVDQAGDGRIKLHVIWSLLNLRAEMPDLFTCGSYRSRPVTGALAGHIFAFERRHEEATAIVVVPRLVDALLNRAAAAPVGEEIWGDTQVEWGEARADQIWRNVLTGEQVTQASGDALLVADALQTFPVAVLVGDGSD
jgi:(1->4)-alpha-D-glucan 1-alpha-D-glucosylmutase